VVLGESGPDAVQLGGYNFFKPGEVVLMRQSSNIVMRGAICGSAMLGLISCSTMNLKQYPEASAAQLQNAQSTNGISVVAQPLLGEKESEEYFGINLLESGILAVHLTIRNDNPHKSYMLPMDSVQIAQGEDAGKLYEPEKQDQEAGEAIGVAGAVLISPLLLAVAVQQLSDASIIRTNFETKKLRTSTLDPEKRVAGFSYFDWQRVKALEAPYFCLKVVDPLEDVSFPYCININMRR